MSGVGITGLIEPLNGGSFPVFEDINGLGGWRTVDNIAARNAIPANFRKEGMVVVCKDTDLAWQLISGILDVNWTELPGAFYQTMQNADGGPLPQEPILHWSADFDLVDDGGLGTTRVSAPHIGLARAEAADALAAAAAAQTTADTAEATGEAAQGTADAALANSVNAQPEDTFYVLPDLAVDASPYFSTVQAAINACLIGTISRIVLPANREFFENLVFSVGTVELYCADAGTCAINPDPFSTAAVLTDGGSANLTAVLLTNVAVKGTVSFGAITFTGSVGLLQVNTNLPTTVVAGAINLPAACAFYVFGPHPGFSTNAAYGSTSFQSFCKLDGNIACAKLALFNATLQGASRTVSAPFVELNNSRIASAGIGPAFTATVVTLLNTSISSGSQPTFSGAVRADEFSAGFLLAKGCTVAGALSLLDGSVTKGPTAFANNVGLTNVAPAGIPVAGTYEIKAQLLRTAAGTAGVASFNVAGTDLVGAYTLPVCTLDIAAVPSRSSGSLIVSTTGAGAIQFSITGITTPGALAATYKIFLRKLDSQVA